MKPPISLRLGRGVALAAALLVTTALTSVADQFGCGTATDWQTWTVFVQGQGVSKGTTVLSLSGSVYIHGNAGVNGPGSVSVKTSLSGSSQIDDLYLRTGDTLTTSGSSMVHNAHQDASSDTRIATSSAELFAESNCLEGMTDTGGYTFSGNGGTTDGFGHLTNINTGSNFTITGTGHIVINLQNFVLTGGTFTLEGTAATTFVFNVSKSFALSGGTKIVLANLGGVANGPDGVQASNVIFNVKGTGPDVAISGSTIFQGILLANNRNVKISGGSVPRGEIIGNKVTLSDGVQLYPASP